MPVLDLNRLLGHLVAGAVAGQLGGSPFALRSRRRRRVFGIGPGKALIGLGALGAALAAWEHATEKRSGTAFPPQPPQPGPSQRPVPGPPPRMGAAAVASRSATPPPLPGSASEPEVAAAGPDADALLLLRAMVAAASADHEVDAEERQAIMGQLSAMSLGAAETELLGRELERPMSLQALAAAATTEELRRQVYAAALLAIDADTQAERAWLARLASAMRLDAATVAAIEQQLGGQA